MTRQALALVALCSAPFVLYANPNHNVNQIVGDRALGMAGAYAGISDDPAGMYYNPAGIAYSHSTNISANVNTLQALDITYQDALAGEFDYNRNSFQVLPNFFGVLQPLGGWMVGFSSSIVDSVQENQDQDFLPFGVIERFILNTSKVDTIYNIGPTVATKLIDELSIGLSLHFHYRRAELISNQHLIYSAEQTENLDMRWVNFYSKLSEQGIRPKLGIQWSPAANWSIGLVVDKTFLVAASETQQKAHCVTNNSTVGCLDFPDVDQNPDDRQDPEITEYQGTRTYPWQVRTGIAWFPTSALLVSADAIYNSATAASEETGYAGREQTLDGAVGLEWYWSPQWAVRGGAYTAFASTPEVITGQTGQEGHIDIYGLTTSITRFNKGSAISLGLIGNYGSGSSQIVADSTAIQETTILGMTAFFTTSYRY
ncbi:OmpP1/FadL family transporter [Reinekea sp.]|jgi:long-chain fatty acid transport protein|uniref:OmpP1/FadL family transporter n=1 Tax=Reinekea sp. TaxID=1970455 RepID=UPI002A81A8AB|nr:outer membrane protein transport protein [Reinekea sp.]